MKRTLLWIPMSLLLAISGSIQASEAPQKLADMFDTFFQENLEMNPIQATAIGDLRYNDQLPNVLGEDFRRQQTEFNQRWLERIQSVSRDELTGQDRLSYDIFVYDRKQALEGDRYPGQEIPLNQFFSFPNFIAQMGSGQSIQPFQTVEQYQDWLKRMDAVVVIWDQAIANMREGMQHKVVQPRAIMEKVLPQLAAHVVDDVEESLFMGPVKRFPEDFSEADRERLTAAYRSAVATKMIPAYERLHDFVRDEYLPKTRDTVGYYDLPEGIDWYNYQIKTFTTTDLTADEIHDFGLAEVARIRGEMESVMEQVGFEGDLQDFFRHLQEEDRYYFDNAEDLLQGYRDLQSKIDAVLPKLFDVMPKANYEVRAVEAFRAQSSAGASYQPGTPDGSRPGVFYVNTYNLKGQPKFGMETLSIHEASPGHHFQISIQQEIEDLPAFRRFGGYSAFSEGWALYAESLGKEMGLFSDPYQYYGRLSDEMLRAMRLVVDTGLHAKGWSREKAIQFMKDNSSMAETDVVAEVERYIAIPGQALAYKVGQRVIANLRATAEEQLGESFDIRDFHRQVLVDGAMPLDVLSRKIGEWIEAQKQSDRIAAH
jgi:uncharacterized protein (DUF885 family)